MKQVRLIFALLFVLLFNVLNADQNGFLGLVSPTGLGNLESEISIQHRFRGAFDEEPFDTFFGTNRGANIALFYRQAFLYNAELKLGYIKDNTEYLVEGSWLLPLKDFPVQAQINLQFFSYEDFFNPEQRHDNVMFVLAAQNEPLWKRLVFNANLGYDAENERLVSGIGAKVKILPSLSWLAEYYPVWDRDSAPQDVQLQIRNKDSFSTGIKLDTYGHNFMFMLGNNEGMTLRKSTLGSITSDLKFGFNIQRRFGFFQLI